MKKSIIVFLTFISTIPIFAILTPVLLLKNEYKDPIIANVAYNNDKPSDIIIINTNNTKSVGCLSEIKSLSLKTTIAGSLDKNIMSFVQKLQEKAQSSQNDGVTEIIIHNSTEWKISSEWKKEIKPINNIS